jgi:cytochrome oxidase assembly protein ShyY1
MNRSPASIQPAANRRAVRRMTITVAMLLPLTIALGVWQLQRAESKRTEQLRFVDAMAGGARIPGEGAPGPDYARLRLVGRYLDRSFLVDNRTHEGLAGYWVVTPLESRDGRRWLVNRGWVPAPATRSELPPVPTPEGIVDVTAVLWPLAKARPKLDAEPGWPSRVQGLDPAAMAELTGALPRELRLEGNQAGALAPTPLTIGSGPERHLGYAVQWFGLAGVLMVGWGVFRRRVGRRR